MQHFSQYFRNLEKNKEFKKMHSAYHDRHALILHLLVSKQDGTES